MRVDPSHWRQVTREELWVTSKLWNTYHAPEHVPLALKRTLEDLGACLGQWLLVGPSGWGVMVYGSEDHVLFRGFGGTFSHVDSAVSTRKHT